MTAGDTDYRAEMPGATPESSGRNLRGYGAGGSSVTARRANSHPESKRMMEAAVERGKILVSLLRHLRRLQCST